MRLAILVLDFVSLFRTTEAMTGVRGSCDVHRTLPKQCNLRTRSAGFFFLKYYAIDVPRSLGPAGPAAEFL